MWTRVEGKKRRRIGIVDTNEPAVFCLHWNRLLPHPSPILCFLGQNDDGYGKTQGGGGGGLKGRREV
jgi:hypothetical protein